MLEAERRELLARQKEVQDQELQLLEREENARAGFVAQQSSALAELRQRKTELEAELQALPVKLSEVHAGWVKDMETLRQRLEGEARQARAQLATELAERRLQAEQQLEQERQRVHKSLEAWREELESRESTLEQQRQKLRQERIQLRADAELLEDGKRLLEKRVEQKAAARVESLQAELESTRLLFEDTRRDRNHLQAELRKVEEANRQFEQRSPREVLEQLRSLEEQRRKLEQELATRPNEQEKQRLRQLDAEHEQRELELARLRRENSELKARLGNHAIAVSELESLKRQKEAAETYNKALGSALEEYERKVGELIQRARSQPAFPLCAAMDEDTGLQREVEVEERVPRLDKFCKDLRHRLAYNPQTKQELYYSERDVRAFVAGLAMSRLHLLQGISGTGKTSLPREFARAVGGAFTLVEVQAGWRDRDDLLGYFNAFEGRHYESDFLLALYRAQTPAFRDRLCLIVLDEMNLSRPEQYFANLLAQLEQPETKREVRLVTDPTQKPPQRFRDRHTLAIPSNVWFIGTANHDETTVEFADKTYDRAHVMELPRHRQAVQAEHRSERPPVSYKALLRAFEEARQKHEAGAKTVARVLDQHLSPVLDAHFQVGWGSRLERQVADFVPVVLASGGSEVEAADHLIATKLLRKIRGRHETQQEDLDALEEAVSKAFKSLQGRLAPDQSQSLKLIKDERRQPRELEEEGVDAA
ncbi:hypothetical protein [Archangium lansingense]|uniref:Uncharacterized protein n=2 Tax=Archangium lansingense TaxID=2995310 RepID=A0ABT4AMV6_9BACT|nr:hypothetical protein [Archangium lansinium]MCY1083023.1 hypothetical protein [Archangium lansinium]